MHRLKKFRLYIVAFVVAVVFTIAAAVTFEFGVNTVHDQEHWSRHTGDVLDAAADAQAAAETALHHGRQALLDPSIDPKPARADAFKALDAIKRKVADNPEQITNVDVITASLDRRFEFQDAQRNQAQRKNGAITLNIETTAAGSASQAAVENAFTKLRITELSLRQSRDAERVEQQKRLIRGIRIFGLIAAISIIAAIILGAQEVHFRGDIAEHAKKLLSDPRQLTAGQRDEVNELLEFIEQGKQEKANRSTVLKLL